MKDNVINKIDIQYFKVPLQDNLVDALHGKHDNFELITATVYTNDGRSGTGYTYTGGIGGSAIVDLLRNDLVPRLIGKTFKTPEEMNQYMNRSIHYVARGGVASFSISALDIAFWDLKLKTENTALADYFGTRNQKVRTYYGGIDLMFSEEKLLSNIQKQLENGHTAIKIKVGKENEEEDISRVKAVRKLIGDDAMFMVDANMVWPVEKAMRMAKRLEEFHIKWLEEPTNPDDYEGYARIAQASNTPIAMGENLHTVYEHRLALDVGRIQYPIPDCSNVCGITGFFEVAKLAKEKGTIFQFALEHFRRMKPHVSGVSLCHFITNWPIIKWDIIDYYGEEKLSYEFVKRSYQPLLPSMQFEKRRWLPGETFHAQLWVVNDYYKEFKDLQLSYEIIYPNGQTTKSAENTITVEENSSKKYQEIQFVVEGEKGSSFGVKLILKQNGTLLAQNEYRLLIDDQEEAKKKAFELYTYMHEQRRKYGRGYYRYMPELVYDTDFSKSCEDSEPHNMN